MVWSFPGRVVVIGLLFAMSGGTGCHDQGEGVLGEACEGDGECRSGFCWAGCRDPGVDDDGDGLSNSRERELGLSPTHADSDGDGLMDGDEPGDRDGDGRPDALESRVGDIDGDCLPDELDPSDETVALEELVSLCRQDGVCAGAAVTARCERGLVCDYGAVAGFEGEETRCDGRDNDCDGMTDEGLVYVESTGILKVLGEVCVGRGECSDEVGVVECSDAGEIVCSVDRQGSENAGASDDIDCDGLDNDCDGEVDEGISWLEPDTGLVRRYGSACRARGVCGLLAGIVECSAAGRGICSTEPGGSADRSGPERCDGLDEDCDGRVDEGVAYLEAGVALAVGQPCGRGVCAGTVVSCAGGVAVCPGLELLSDEVCNERDDDCDGEVDEAIDVVKGCPVEGECAGRDVVASCEDGLLCRYRAGDELLEVPARESRCDGRDEDCDGATDEDILAPDGARLGDACLGSGLCATVQGFYICADSGQSGEAGLVCSADAGLAETCDGVDNDCDGATDEGLDNVATCNGPGVCAAASPFALCEGGAWTCPHESLSDYREEELADIDCDGLDNDCDGLVDEGSRRLPTGALMPLADAPPARVAAAMGAGGGGLWVHGGLERSPLDKVEVRGGLWRYGHGDENAAASATSGSWRRLAPGPVRAGHALAADARYVYLQGGFEVVDREFPGLGPGGQAVFSMWAFDIAGGTWSEVEQQVIGFEAGPDPVVRILERAHHALVAMSPGLLVLHGGLAREGAPEALLGRVTVEDGALVCRWSAIPGAGWRVGHSAIGLDVAGDAWVVLAGGIATGASTPSGWAAFSLEGQMALTSSTGPLLEIKPGLVALAGEVVALGASSHRVEIAVGSGLLSLIDRPLDLTLAPPVVVGRLPASSGGSGEVIGFSLSSGEAVEVTEAETGPALSRRADLVRPAPRMGGALLPGGAVARPDTTADTSALWLMGGRNSDGRPLEDLWAWPLPSGPWVEVSSRSGVGGDSTFAALDGVLWAAGAASPGGTQLAQLVTGAENTWRSVAATGVAPLSVKAMSAVEVDGQTSIFTISEVTGGLAMHEARVGESAAWSLLGEWPGAALPLVIGPGPDTSLTLVARVGDAMAQRRLTRAGPGDVVLLAGEAPRLGSSAWDTTRALGYLLDHGRVWVLEPADALEPGGSITATAVDGVWPGAVTYAPDGALWVFGANLVRVPLGCADP